jgi:hypothetical protein
LFPYTSNSRRIVGTLRPLNGAVEAAATAPGAAGRAGKPSTMNVWSMVLYALGAFAGALLRAVKRNMLLLWID